MPRKKTNPTTATAPKTSPKPKRSAGLKAPRKTTRPAAKKTAVPKAPKTAAIKKAVVRAKAVPSPAKPPEAVWKKPARQGETQMVAFIRDPHCIFTYWEVTPESIEEVKRQLTGEYKESAMVLRVFRTGPEGQTELIQEIRVEPGEMNRYVELKENSGSYFIEIAQKAPSGRTIVYARSNKVMTGTSFEPQGGLSGASDPQWETPAGLLEYFSEAEGEQTLAAQPGISSAEAYRRSLLKKKMDRYSASRMG